MPMPLPAKRRVELERLIAERDFESPAALALDADLLAAATPAAGSPVAPTDAQTLLVASCRYEADVARAGFGAFLALRRGDTAREALAFCTQRSLAKPAALLACAIAAASGAPPLDAGLLAALTEDFLALNAAPAFRAARLTHALDHAAEFFATFAALRRAPVKVLRAASSGRAVGT